MPDENSSTSRLINKHIIYDKIEDNDEQLEAEEVLITMVPSLDGKKFQVYLASNLKNNSLFRLPIPSAVSEDDALVNTYNFLAETLEALEEKISEKNGTIMEFESDEDPKNSLE